MERDGTLGAKPAGDGERTFPKHPGLTRVPNLGDVEHPCIPENVGIVLQMTFRDKAYNGKTSGAFPCLRQGALPWGCVHV